MAAAARGGSKDLEFRHAVGPGIGHIRLWAPSPLFMQAGDGLRLRREDPSGALPGMVDELCEWREAQPAPERQAAESGAGWQTAPELWREYMREDIPRLFGTSFSPGNWNSGIVRLGADLVLLTTLKKANMTAGNHYDDGFLSASRMQWQSQTRTRRDSRIGRMLKGAEPGSRVHLFVRNGKLRSGRAAPFLYCGRPVFEGWEGETPITVTWRLPEDVPPHLRPALGIGTAV
ncbi:DUF3427 domain-containing protein [Mangrovicoccus ximenensis]|uniref:DUF3427 domain-containing protein n=1 Tax=Mangrovicoccus ximenensis TaxID=1911570 RepID=UPI000D36CF0D|nr:DUF3427 domain-containing protein [Mangrovicoccus ximenensis]